MNQLFSFLFGLLLGLCVAMLCFYPQILSINTQAKTPSDKTVHSASLYNETLAEKLFNEVRVLCWIATSVENHKKKASYVKKTWGKRCNKLLFMSTKSDTELETIALPVKEGRDTLWDKTKNAFQYVYKHHADDADWFLKADDDK
jgi:glycoprotein-N-acetylgalactosamine 3-beta-galactosyltransferase